MHKLALYNGTLMSLVLLEEKLASTAGLQIWECSCGSKFVTVYYASYHCEKQHKGEKFKDRVNLRKDLSTDTKLWNMFYTSVSDVIIKTTSTENEICSATKLEKIPEPKACGSKDAEMKKRKTEDCDSSTDAMVAKKRKLANADDSQPTSYIDIGTNTDECKTIKLELQPESTTSGFNVLHETESRTILANQNSGIIDYDNFSLKLESDDGYKENSLFAPKAPRKCLNDALDVSTQTTPIGLQIDFVLIKNRDSEDSDCQITGVTASTQTESNQENCNAMDLDSTTSVKSNESDEPPRRFSMCLHPSESWNSPTKAGTNADTLVASTSAVQPINNIQNMIFDSMLPPPIPPYNGPVQTAYIMRPELPYPIPDPAVYPYPYFGLVYDNGLLLHPDGSPTVFHWQKRAEYYQEVKSKNLNPMAARELWMLRNVPNSLVNYNLG